MKKNRILLFTLICFMLVGVLGFYTDDVSNGITKGLDLDGGFEIVYQVKPLNEGDALPSMTSISRSVSKRIDILGVSEPQITIEGDDRIRVQLAGVKDLASAQSVISTTANLSFRDVNDELLMDSSVLQEGGASLSFENGVPVVSLKIEDNDKFGEVTAKLASSASGENLIVTWLDFDPAVDSYAKESQLEDLGQTPAYISAASVSTRIDGDAVIKGNFTDESARELADLINAGSLPVQMEEIYSNVVSAEYGQDAYSMTMIAGMFGLLAIMLFMIIVYRLPGVISAIVLPCFVFLNIAIYNVMGGVLTLPGIAALILGIGMTVDANIITFERIKDELYLGRTVKKANEQGHKRAFLTIFDAQFTTFISALIMYIFGTGAVKGFATMFMVTVFCTLTLQIFLSRLLLSLLVNSGVLDNKKSLFGVKTSDIPDLTKNEEKRHKDIFTGIDFVKISKKFIISSLAIIFIGIGFSTYHGLKGDNALNLGIDFVSGTNITVISDDALIDSEVTAQFIEFGYTPSRVQISGTDAKIANVTLKESVTSENMVALKENIVATYGNEPNDSVVTPVVGRELVINAFTLSIVAWIAMMIYISLRFKWDYGVSCIIALVHDILIVLAVFAIFRFEVDSSFIAVILAIIGYSINDSIVIFDRIRENVAKSEKVKMLPEDYKAIVNDAIVQTAMRSIFNTLTTLIPVIFLLSMGSPEIFVFNVAIFIGLIAGSYSSLFIAAQAWLWIRVHIKPKIKKRKKDHKKRNEPTEMTFIGIND